MQLFGYLCSPLCRARATSTGLSVPVFAGQKSVIEARRWRMIGRSAGVTAGVLALVFGAWFWYAWFGCVPKVVFSVRFPEFSYSGTALLAGKNREQVVFLHGDTLARHEFKSRKQIWSRQLIDRKLIAAEVERDMKRFSDLHAKMADEGYSGPYRGPSAEELQKDKEREAAALLELQVRGENIWVLTPEKVVLYDWATGKETKVYSAAMGEVIPQRDEVFILEPLAETPRITRIDLVTAKADVTDLGGLSDAKGQGAIKQAAQAFAGQIAGNRPLDPAAVAEQVSRLPIQARIALPALLAVRMNQERLEAELNDMPLLKPAAGQQRRQPSSSNILIPTREGILGMRVELLESRIVEHVAMKAAPVKPVLEGNLKASQSLEAANEMLNEMQRNVGGDRVREDLSRYAVTIRSLDSEASWSGEVIGPPRLIPLETVNVLVSSKSILVLDKGHKKLWQSALSYDVPLGGGADFDPSDEEGALNIGPCIERKESLYVFDHGVLTAFDLKTGNARWRLPTVGIAGVFFDEKDMMYVNTTTAKHERIKYSRQIDVTDIPGAMMLKVDSRNGKVLWSNNVNGWVSHIRGKYIFAVNSYAMSEREESLIGTSFHTGFEKKSFLRIRRINPKTGRAVWEHFEQRAPLDLQFEDTFIRLVFRKEVEILKFLPL
jgi:hypothetical protein